MKNSMLNNFPFFFPFPALSQQPREGCAWLFAGFSVGPCIALS